MLTEVEILVRDAAQARNRMLGEITHLTPRQGVFKPDPDRWSIAEVVEHLVHAEQAGIRMMWTGLEALREGNPVWKEAHPDRGKPLDVIAEKRMRPKEVAPPGAMPIHGGPLAYWREALRSCQTLLEGLGTVFTAEELNELVVPHFLMGPLTARQRFEFIRWHIDHHMLQIQALQEHSSFPR